MISKLNDDIIFLIWYYLNHKDSISFHETNKHICILGKKKGYLKNIKLRETIDYNYFEYHHSRIQTLYKIAFFKIIDPIQTVNTLYNLNIWTETVEFDRCYFILYDLNPETIQYKTKTLIITNSIIECIKFGNTLNLHWSKFPNLRKVCIECSTIRNIEQIVLCKNLEEINIGIKIIHISIPHLVQKIKSKLPKLKKINIYSKYLEYTELSPLQYTY